MRTMLRNAHGPMLRAVQRMVRAEAGELTTLIVESVFCEDWASATFVGQRHRFDLRLDGPEASAAAARIAALIGEVEIVVAGHIVAVIAVVSDAQVGSSHILTLDALTLED